MMFSDDGIPELEDNATGLPYDSTLDEFEWLYNMESKEEG